MLRLYDTARGSVVPLEPREPGKVSMYVCGPTVYGSPHIGHGRQTLVYDILRRYLEWTGIEVRHVSNVTDIDDQIINRAQREDRDWSEVATTYEAEHYEAMDALGIRRPHQDPHATAFVDDMIELVSDLVAKGSAYETSDGVYLEVGEVDGYGLLARQPLESLRAGARVETIDEKRSPLDFVLWKKAKPGEPSWESPWGPGRPGWHTECVVMSLDLLGEGFDLHGGGQDLRFPHHENERAQAVALGRRFARHWIHHGFVELEGEKMSKSLGNIVNLDDLLQTADHRVLRLVVLQSHYRAPIEVTRDTITQAENTLARIDDFARRFVSARGGLADADLLARFRQHMDDDLDTPAAMAVLFEGQRRANRDGDEAAAAAVWEMAEAVGLELRSEVGEASAEALALVRERNEARDRKDWAAADAVRDQLRSLGYEVTDTSEGTKIRPL